MDYVGIFIVGVVFGFVAAACASNSIDKKSAESGFVKLDGKIYRLSEPLEKNN